MRNFITVIVVIAASALTAPTAMAAQPDYLSIFTRVAQQHFDRGATPSCGAPRYEWHARPAFDALVKAPHAAGAAYTDGSCRVLFAKDRWAVEGPLAMCDLVVHEIGHLYGREHTQAGVMGPGDNAGSAPCVGIFRSIYWCKRTPAGVGWEKASSCQYAWRLRKGIA